MIRVAVTGAGLEFPGLSGPSALLDPSAAPPSPPPFAPEQKLGRTGLLYKDRATRLALCAARDALADAGLPLPAAECPHPERLGVVVGSNLGNLDTVCQVVTAIRRKGVRDTSPLDLPNASSNVIASTIAIRHGAQAVNLTVCSGATAGVDALHLAANAIRTARAERVIVVGVEPVNAVVTRLMAESAAAWLGSADGLRLGEGAAALVLEADWSAAARGRSAYGWIGGYGYGAGARVEDSVRAAVGDERPPSLWFTPQAAYAPTERAVRDACRLWDGGAPRCVDLARWLGDTYGASGVLQALAACLHLRAGEPAALVTSGACWGDGSASLLLRATG